MSENPAWKDVFLNRAFFADLCAALSAVLPSVDTDAFLGRVFTAGWAERALKDKVRHTTLALRPGLPAAYRDALVILLQVPPRMTSRDFGLIIFPDFVEVYGLDDWEASIPALEVFTQTMSAEFAIRPFILRDVGRGMAQMRAWAEHPEASVRRLATEGCRPRLPWGVALAPLKRDPAPILPILERLKDDPDESVQRSVANNLNDIAKDHPDVVIGVLRRWQAGASAEVTWITRHALRTLIKQGHPEALALLGVQSGAAVSVRDLRVEPAVVPLGGEVRFSFAIVSTGDAPQDLVIDYVVYLARKNGTQTPKVFKLARRTLEPGATITLSKTQSFAPISTRRYYAGPHAIAVQVNGAILARAEFEVTE